MDRFTKLKDKKTENEANLPDGWKRVRLGEILSFRNGKSPQIVDGGMYPIYGSNGLIGFTNDYFLNGVFLLVGRVGASGETHLVSGKVWASDNCLIGECKSDTTPVFIYYLLKYLDLKKFITQTAQPLITQSFVNNLQIILPPLPEQRKIAEILETVDNAIEKTDRIIEKYKRIKQGLMQDLLTRGIVESDELGVMSYELRDEKKHRFKDSPLGRIPEEWEVVE
ncbi:MAG TPA: restriction endonuclease subunit S, partial [bacterium]|nr:restriction endonuclease subunit S [bacterium]